MPRKRKPGPKKRRVRRQRGSSAFTDFFTKRIPGAAKVIYHKALKPAGQFIKDNRILSTVADMVPDPRAKIAGTVLRKVGLGRAGPRMMIMPMPRPRAVGKGRRQQGGLHALNGRMYLI